MRPSSHCLLAITVALGLSSMGAAAQEPGELNARLGAFDPQCLDLYDGLEMCGQLETEEKPCEDVRSAEDVPFNNVQALLDHWPERYGARKQWFDYCQKACNGKGTPGIVEFADKVCHTTLTPRAK